MPSYQSRLHPILDQTIEIPIADAGAFITHEGLLQAVICSREESMEYMQTIYQDFQHAKGVETIREMSTMLRRRNSDRVQHDESEDEDHPQHPFLAMLKRELESRNTHVQEDESTEES